MIESDDYREETARLREDPIIVAMEEELGYLSRAELDSYAFTVAASDEYHARGGSGDFSIGGPARAIRAIRRARDA